MGSDRQISPATAGIVIAIVLILAVLVGFWYMNSRPKDTIAEQVLKERGDNPNAVNAANAPLQGTPPKPGASDYARPAGAPAPPRPTR